MCAAAFFYSPAGHEVVCRTDRWKSRGCWRLSLADGSEVRMGSGRSEAGILVEIKAAFEGLSLHSARNEKNTRVDFDLSYRLSSRSV